MFLDVSRHAKVSGWVRTPDDFSTHLLDIYEFPNITIDEPEAAAPAEKKKAASPLEMMKAGKAAASTADKPMSPLQMMKAKAAEQGGDKPLSPLGRCVPERKRLRRNRRSN